jgi:hypothetical protein
VQLRTDFKSSRCCKRVITDYILSNKLGIDRGIWITLTFYVTNLEAILSDYTKLITSSSYREGPKRPKSLLALFYSKGLLNDPHFTRKKDDHTLEFYKVFTIQLIL